MKRLVLLAGCGLGALGCAPTMNFLSAGGVTAERTARGADTRETFRPPVVASQITGENAKEKAKALEEELDRDLQAAIDARDREK